MGRGRLFIISLAVLLLLIAGPLALAQDNPDDATPIPGAQTYVVQRGDTLFRIATRFDLTTAELAAANNITNPQLIFVGQVLQIPGPTQPEDQTPAPPPPPTTTYVVQRGDSLMRIAARFNTTVSELIRLNNLANPNIIIPGQTLIIPVTDETVPLPTVVLTPEPDEPEPVITPEPPPLPVSAQFGFGVLVFYEEQDAPTLAQQVADLGMDWVRLRVEWRTIEPTPGQLELDELDAVIGQLQAGGFQILLTVTHAPAWTRTSADENGPPDDLLAFTDFVSTLAERYSGVVNAYQIWDEPNLRRNWNCERRICDIDYIEMLRQAYVAIKTADPLAQVITAGLAPTRFNDGLNAIDDRLFLETLYANGVQAISDGIGAHPGGWANPPDALCCEPTGNVQTHYESDVFYFRENLSTYREIMLRFNDAETSLWVTKFGWGTSEDTDPPGEINIFVTYTSLNQQAIFVPRAFELAQELGYVGPMFLDNLNGCQSVQSQLLAELCYTSLISPDGIPRPVFDAVRQLDKSAATSDEPAPVFVPLPPDFENDEEETDDEAEEPVSLTPVG